MIRRWTHVHTLATGLVFGLVLDREALVIFALGIALGAGVVFGWSKLRRLAGWSRGAVSGALSSVERLREAEIERKLAAAMMDRTRAETRLRAAKEQEAALEDEYRRGVIDGDDARSAGFQHRPTWALLADDPEGSVLS
jgi:Sec-independent protein translocase protein TatA